MLDYAWIIPMLPAASFFLILFFGKKLPRKGSELGIAAVGIAFALALATNVSWWDHVDNPDESSGTHVEAVAGSEGGERGVAPGEEGAAFDESEDEHETVEPVTQEARGEQRKAITLATSSAVPKRPIGMFSCTKRAMPSGSSCCRFHHVPPGDAIEPGATVLTRMLSGANSIAIALAWLISAAFIAL